MPVWSEPSGVGCAGRQRVIARGTNEAAERPSGQFLVIGNGECRDVAILDEDDMAATLAVNFPASLLEIGTASAPLKTGSRPIRS